MTIMKLPENEVVDPRIHQGVTNDIISALGPSDYTWDVASIPFGDGSGGLTEKAGFTFVTGTNTLNIVNIVNTTMDASGAVTGATFSADTGAKTVTGYIRTLAGTAAAGTGAFNIPAGADLAAAVVGTFEHTGGLLKFTRADSAATATRSAIPYTGAGTVVGAIAPATTDIPISQGNYFAWTTAAGDVDLNVPAADDAYKYAGQIITLVITADGAGDRTVSSTSSEFHILTPPVVTRSTTREFVFEYTGAEYREITPSALLLASGSAAGVPFTFTSGTLKATPAVGGMEYNSTTGLTFTNADSIRRTVGYTDQYDSLFGTILATQPDVGVATATLIGHKTAVSDVSDGGGAASGDDADGYWVSLSTGAVAGQDCSRAAFGAWATPKILFSQNIDVVGRWKTGANTDCRYHFGVFPSDPKGAAKGPSNSAYIRYDSVTDGTVFWRYGGVDNAGTEFKVASTVAVEASTIYVMRIVCSASRVDYYINGVCIGSQSTAIPTAATAETAGVSALSIAGTNLAVKVGRIAARISG